MKLFLSFMLLLVLIPVSHAFEGLESGTSLKIFNRINCGSSVTCTRTGNGIFNIDTSGVFATDIVGDGTDTLSGFLQTQIVAATTTITAAECGSTFINSATGTQIELPEASGVLGCRLTFITANAVNLDINPDDADQILVLTNAAGDAIRNATVGNSVTLEASSASTWTQISAIGTYTDIN